MSKIIYNNMSSSLNLKELLLQIQLNEKEVDVFLGLVKTGKGTATNISRETNITRTHIYDIVQTLIEKGLVSEVETSGIKTYEAVDHAGLLAFVSREQKKLQRVEKKLEQLSSEFHALQVGEQQKTKVRFFEGIEGVENIYAEVRTDLKKQTTPFELLTIFSPQNLEKIIPNFQYLDYPGMMGRDIVAEDNLLPRYIEEMSQSKNKTAYKVWPKEKGFFPTDSIAWKNKIAYIDLADYPSGIIVENTSQFQTFTMWFNNLWDNLT